MQFQCWRLQSIPLLIFLLWLKGSCASRPSVFFSCKWCLQLKKNREITGCPASKLFGYIFLCVAWAQTSQLWTIGNWKPAMVGSVFCTLFYGILFLSFFIFCFGFHAEMVSKSCIMIFNDKKNINLLQFTCAFFLLFFCNFNYLYVHRVYRFARSSILLATVDYEHWWNTLGREWHRAEVHANPFRTRPATRHHGVPSLGTSTNR